MFTHTGRLETPVYELMGRILLWCVCADLLPAVFELWLAGVCGGRLDERRDRGREREREQRDRTKQAAPHSLSVSVSLKPSLALPHSLADCCNLGRERVGCGLGCESASSLRCDPL